MRAYSIGVIFLLVLVSCTRNPLKKREDALRKNTSTINLSDDLPFTGLVESIRREASLWKAKPETAKAVFGKKTLPAKTYAAALEHAAKLLESTTDKAVVLQALAKDFDLYEVYGGEGWSKVLLTSYFEPLLKGSLKKTSQFSQPLYKTPSDLIEIAMSKGDDRFSDLGQLRGRLAPTKTARGTAQIIPYLTREEIDLKNGLQGKRLELCYLDPIDAFFLHIQGSGTLMLEKGELFRVGYADQNGHSYQAIGRHLLDVIALEKMTLQTIELHLRSLPFDNMMSVLAKNPSYVFFQKREGPALTSNGTPVIAGRTIATDGRFFPKGSLAFLKFETPIFDTPDAIAPVRWEKTARLVLDQDSGGAITGGGRVDLFWGAGDSAKQSAGVIKQSAELYYLVPKDALVEDLSRS